MRKDQDRALALGDVECRLVEKYAALAFNLVGQAHHGTTGFAFIEVHGIEDQATRRQVRAEAEKMLGELGFPVELVSGRDIFHVKPVRPRHG